MAAEQVSPVVGVAQGCTACCGGLHSLNRKLVELATLAWIPWLHPHRLLEPDGCIPKAADEANWRR